MPEIAVGTAVSRRELAIRVARMFEQDGCPREITAHIVNDTTYTQLNQLASIPRINHVDRLSSCFNRGDTYFDGDTLSVLVDEEHRTFVHVNVNDRVLNEQMLAENQEAVRRALGIENIHEHTNEHDHAQDIESTFRSGLITPIDTSTLTSRLVIDDSISTEHIKGTSIGIENLMINEIGLPSVIFNTDVFWLFIISNPPILIVNEYH